jgi:DNA modification methylase
MNQLEQLELFPTVSKRKKVEQDYSSTFSGNMSLPIHKWYRYTAGFSAEWVRQLIIQEKRNGRINVIDPFAGSGTVLIESDFQGVSSMGIESHPYIFKIAKTKLNWSFSPEILYKKALAFLDDAQRRTPMNLNYPDLIGRCFPEHFLQKLDKFKSAWMEFPEDEPIKDFIWFIITSILRLCSPVGTAQWQYIQPSKTKSKVLDPDVAFEQKLVEICTDLKTMQSSIKNSNIAVIFQEDAREINSIPDKWGDLVITSPPYANNYDYADATRFEMMFWGDIDGWKDLQGTVRKGLIRACTQHVSSMGKEIESFLKDDKLLSIQNELIPTFEELKQVRLSHGGKKNYHLMITAYFRDMADVFLSLRKKTKDNSLMCFVIGDSAPYGVYVPVDKWLGELALSAGFKSYSFEKLRDRNGKWKNRKHDVPLQEGRLWIKG